MVTPFGEMNFNMEADKVSELVQRAFQYAAGTLPTTEDVGTTATAPQPAQEQPKPQRIEIKPHRRVDSLFGDFGEQRQEEREPEEYRGFLLIKCKHCGKLKGFCAKNNITEYTCDCGEKTELHDLKPAFLKCKCGGDYKYKTNATDERFEYNCLSCGSPVDMELNSRRNTYVTI
jgi:hypothetical protein